MLAGELLTTVTTAGCRLQVVGGALRMIDQTLLAKLGLAPHEARPGEALRCVWTGGRPGGRTRPLHALPAVVRGLAYKKTSMDGSKRGRL